MQKNNNTQTNNIHTGNLILINSTYGLQTQNKDLLIPILEDRPDMLLQRDAATLLNKLMEDIHGWSHITPVSGWRSEEEQQSIWRDSLKDNGEDFTAKYVAFPGHSEHQSGLAIDLGIQKEYIDFIRPDFPDTGICRTFRKQAAMYGFILRYPSNKENITGIAYEPWHFRYVGIPHARIMEQQELTLEEYIDFIRRYPYKTRPYHFHSDHHNIEIGFIRQDCPFTLPGDCPYTLSGNNVDGFILTEWRSDNV